MKNEIRIDPRDLIMSPYVGCPKCTAVEYGVLSVSDTRCVRRCRVCWFTGTVYLPNIRKKIVYLDQFAFSNIMKVLSPDTKGHQRTVLEPLWRQLFETLSVVCHLQLVACPDSREHQQESLTSPFYSSLKSTYENFSGGVSFVDAESIRIRQISALAKSWLRGEPPKFDFDAESISSGRLHEWNGRFFVTVDGTLPGTVEELRARRSRSHKGLTQVFETWQKEKRSFKEVFATEKNSYGPNILRSYVEACQRRQLAAVRMIQGKTHELDDLLPSYAETLITSLQHVFRQALLDDRQGDAKIIEFFRSGAINEAPFNLIAAAMYASLAAKAAAGQKEIPNEGTFTDVNVISTLLPYCDAMFVDNKAKALLQDIPKNYALPHECKIFSPKTGTEFIQYLVTTKDSMSLEHLKLVEEVYGPDPMKPPTGIYGVGANKRAIRSKK